jgi:predicted O-methyltransferase YrrM
LLTCKIPKVRLETILSGASISGVEIPLVADHYERPSLYEQFVLGTLVRVLQPKRCFEIGTSLGFTTGVIASNSSPDCRVETLDISSETRIGSAFRNTPSAAKIRQHIAPSTGFDFDAHKGQIDFVFVDGSHEFEDVLRDTANTFSMLSPTGVALWHDVSPDYPGVVKALKVCDGRKDIRLIRDTSLGFYAKPKAFENRW